MGIALLVLWSTGFLPAASGQGTLEDYQRAAKLLTGNAIKLVPNAKIQAYWLPNSETFYYSRQSSDGKEFVLVDPVAKTRKPAFDHASIAAALSKATDGKYTAGTLPFDHFEFVDGGTAIRFDLKNDQWTCHMAGDCLRTGKAAIVDQIARGNRAEVTSPDGHYAAFMRNHNLFLRTIGSEREREIQLSFDGIEDDDYASYGRYISNQESGRAQPPDVLWSPDSKKLLAYRYDQRKIGEMYLLQSAPPKGVRPRLFSYHFSFPGDPNVGVQTPIVFDVGGGGPITLKADSQAVQAVQIGSPIGGHGIWWSSDSQNIYYTQYERGFKELSFWIANPQTGEVRRIIDEKADVPVAAAPLTSNPPLVRVLKGGNEVIWYSQRDGWGHLYRYDAKTGALKNQITQGAWAVRDIDHVDEAGSWVYFSAGGREFGDPYNVYFYRAKLDGSNLQVITPAGGNHSVKFSPSGRFLVDTWSQINVPPQIVLRASDGKSVETVGDLERADVTALVAAGWRAPEPFHVKAEDGTTDLYGVIYRPIQFDPQKQYPVIEDIYPGPQLTNVPKSFESGRDSQDQALAELGFIVVNLDGLGGPFRSRAFQLSSYGKLGQAGDLADHVSALKQLAQRYPYMDLNRVGIYGHSGGGFASARALLLYPDFYKAAVASSGNQDQRGYEAVWGERWEGLVDGDNYLEQVNARLAANLKGKLLLVYGDMDDNVPPALTLQLADALIKANRDFDLLVLPNQNHFGVRNNPYLWRRRWDYFVKNLLHVEPPPNFQLSGGGM